MRKFFAIVLAVAMVMSLAAVSFADPAAATAADIYLKGPYRYDADENLMIQPGTDKTDALRYGSGVYYLIKLHDVTGTTTPNAETSGAPTGIYKEIEKMKVKAEFEMGEDLVESISIVKKYVDIDSSFKDVNNNGTYESATDKKYQIVTDGNFTIGATSSDNGYYYFVEFKIASKQTTSESDIVGTLEFDRKADDEVKGVSQIANPTTIKGIGKIKDVENDFSFNVFYKDNYILDGKTVSDRENLKWDTNYALKFDCDDEIELSFGSANDGNNEGTFTVDVSGQGKVFLNYNTKANEAIVAANPGVKMDFINFNNVKFNRVGEFVYEMDDVVAAYKVVGDKLVEIKGLEVDTDEVSFNTRVLESYVFATAELVNPVVEAPVVEAPVADAVTNPTTGANA